MAQSVWTGLRLTAWAAVFEMRGAVPQRQCGQAPEAAALTDDAEKEKKMKKLLKKFVKDERGLELPEYAVMAALIIALGVAAIALLSDAIHARFTTTAGVINSAVDPAGS